MIGQINYNFAIKWNLYLIFCFTILTMHFFSFLLMIVSVCLIQSYVKFLPPLSVTHFYEITNQSNSFIFFCVNLGIYLITFGLVTFVSSMFLFDFIKKYKETKAEKVKSVSNINISDQQNESSTSSSKAEKKANLFQFTRFFNREDSIDKQFVKTPIPSDIPKVAAPKTAPTLSSKAQSRLSKSRYNKNNTVLRKSFSSQNFKSMN